MTLPPHRFLNYIYHWCITRIGSKEELDDFNEMLLQPLPGSKPKARVIAPTRADLEREGDDFMSFMGQVNSR